jgi:hypothetical protein
MAIPYPQKIQPIILTEPQIQDYQARRRPRKMAIEICVKQDRVQSPFCGDASSPSS